jgi:riboflavin kinase / FMN adenylyltransferase
MGMFDGVHLGHQALINSVVRAAQAKGFVSALVTFFPHPSVVLQHATPFYITSKAEKLAELERLGLDQVVMIEFTPEIAQIRAAQFANLLVEHLNMREMWTGYDFAMGYQREGDAVFLQQVGVELGFSTHTITEPVMISGKPVSSRRIRAALKAGDIHTVNTCLGRRFRLFGFGLNNALYDHHHAILSADLLVFTEQAIPGSGTYACQAWIAQESCWRHAVLDLNKPCGSNSGRKYFKIYIEDVEDELALDQPIPVEVLKNLRVSPTYETVGGRIASIGQ